MGYESKIYIVRKGYQLNRTFDKMEDGTEKRWAMKIAEINLGKISGPPSCFYTEAEDGKKIYKNTDSYIYADDGNPPIIADRYDRPLTECTVQELFDWVTQTIERDDFYGA